MIKERFSKIFEEDQLARVAAIADLYKAESTDIFQHAARLSVLEILRNISAMSDERVPEAWYAIATTARDIDPPFGDRLLSALRESGN